MTTTTRFISLLDAASAIAFARRQQMVTCAEWDDLERAILAAAEAPPDDTSPRYEFRNDLLYRLSTLASGVTEDHACTADDLEQIAYAIEDSVGDWFVVDEVATIAERPWMTTYIAVEFLRRCGLVRGDGLDPRLHAADGFRAEQAIAEFVVGQIKAREQAEER